MTRTDQALDQIVDRVEDFATVQEVIFRRQYTGTVLLHCRNGVPQVVEFPGVQIRLRRGRLDRSEEVNDAT